MLREFGGFAGYYRPYNGEGYEGEFVREQFNSDDTPKNMRQMRSEFGRISYGYKHPQRIRKKVLARRVV